MMEDEEDDIRPTKALPTARIVQKSQSSSVSVVQKTRIQSQMRSSFTSSATSNTASNSIAEEESTTVVPKCQIVTQQASGDSVDLEESEESISEEHIRSSQLSSLQHKISKYGLINKSPNSSSSQEDYEPEVKHLGGGKSGQFLSAGGRVETARSMESLRTAHHRSFLTSSSDRDVRRSTENLEREARLKRRAVSGEEMSLGIEETITAERRRGLFAGSVPQHLSLPPPANYLNLSPGDRRLTILSPHSPHHSQEMLHYSSSSFSTFKMRKNKKSIVLPKLILPRSDSEISEVFFDHSLE